MRITRWFRNKLCGQRRAFILVLLPFLLIPGLAIWHGVVNAWGGHKVDEHAAWLESLGIPTHFEDLYPNPEQSEDEAMSHPAVVAELARHSNDRLDRINDETHGHRIDGLAAYGLRWSQPWEEAATDARNFFDPVRHETEADAAQEIFDVFAPERERLMELTEALARPKAGWSVERITYDGIEQLSFVGLMSTRLLTLAFQEQAFCALIIGDERLAGELLTPILHIYRHTARPPSNAVQYLISRVQFHQWIAVIQEGIRRGAWSDASLRKFSAILASDSQENEFIEAMRGELGLHAATLRQLKSGGSFTSLNPFEDWEWEMNEIHKRAGKVFAMTLIPRGFLLKAHIDDAREFHDRIILKNGAPRKFIEIADLDAAERRREELEQNERAASDPTLVWILETMLERYFYHQSSVVLAQTGIALERHRIKHGVHPESLDALVPEFLTRVPLDPYDGAPLRYRRQADGSPHVWSVGRDRVDDGGKPHRNRNQGDHVWATGKIDGL